MAFIPIRVSNPNVLQNFFAGSKFKQDSDIRKQNQGILQQEAERRTAQSERSDEARGIIGQALGAKGAQRGQLLGQAFALDPGQAQKGLAFLGSLGEQDRAEFLRENESLTRTALDALTIADPNERRQFLSNKSVEFSQLGRTTKNIDEALQGDDNNLNRLLNFQARTGLGVQELAKQQIIAPQQEQRTIATEDRAFGRQKEIQERGFKQASTIQQKGADIREEAQERGFANARELEERKVAVKGSGLTIEVLGKTRLVSDILEKANGPTLLAAGFAERMDVTNKQLAKLDEEGFNAASIIEAARGSSNITASPEFQVFSRARADFITAQLRRESGAAISDTEFVKEEEKFFPRPGDSKRVIEAKRKARNRAVENMKRESKGVYEAQQAAAKFSAEQTQGAKSEPVQVGRFLVEEE